MPFGHDRALVEHQNAVGQRVGFVQVMRGEQHRLAARDQRPDLRPHQAPRFHVEADRWLVEKQQVRIAADGDAEQHALLLAAGKLAEGTVLDVLDAGDAETFPAAAAGWG